MLVRTLADELFGGRAVAPAAANFVNQSLADWYGVLFARWPSIGLAC